MGGCIAVAIALVPALMSSQAMASLAMTGLFCGLVIVSRLLSPPQTDYAASKTTLLIIALLIGMCIAPLIVHSEVAFERFVTYLVYGATTLAVAALIIGASRQGRLAPWGLNPAILGRLIGVGALYAIVRYIEGRGSRGTMVVGAICSIGVIGVASRTSVLALGAVALLLLYFDKSTRRIGRATFLGAASALGLSLGFAFASAGALERFSLTQFTLAQHRTEGNRLDVYEVALRSIVQEPLGVGVGNFSSLHRFILAPHNLLLEFAVELGWVAALVLMATWFRANRVACGLARANRERLLVAVFWYQSAAMFLGGEATLPAVLFYIPLSVLALFRRTPRQQLSGSNPEPVSVASSELAAHS